MAIHSILKCAGCNQIGGFEVYDIGTNGRKRKGRFADIERRRKEADRNRAASKRPRTSANRHTALPPHNSSVSEPGLSKRRHEEAIDISSDEEDITIVGPAPTQRLERPQVKQEQTFPPLPSRTRSPQGNVPKVKKEVFEEDPASPYDEVEEIDDIPIVTISKEHALAYFANLPRHSVAEVVSQLGIEHLRHLYEEDPRWGEIFTRALLHVLEFMRDNKGKIRKGDRPDPWKVADGRELSQPGRQLEDASAIDIAAGRLQHRIHNYLHSEDAPTPLNEREWPEVSELLFGDVL